MSSGIASIAGSLAGLLNAVPVCVDAYVLADYDVMFPPRLPVVFKASGVLV